MLETQVLSLCASPYTRAFLLPVALWKCQRVRGAASLPSPCVHLCLNTSHSTHTAKGLIAPKTEHKSLRDKGAFRHDCLCVVQ